MDYENMERKILEEEPYDWRKHFLFDLPDMLYFAVKIIVLLAVTRFAIAALTESFLHVAMTELPAFCEKLK